MAPFHLWTYDSDHDLYTRSDGRAITGEFLR